MLKTCKEAFYKYGNSVRPAEVSELDESSIQGMPSTNTASSPLLGACPMCEGDDSDYGHGRICWDQGETIGPDSKRGDCHVGTARCSASTSPLREAAPTDHVLPETCA